MHYVNSFERINVCVDLEYFLDCGVVLIEIDCYALSVLSVSNVVSFRLLIALDSHRRSKILGIDWLKGLVILECALQSNVCCGSILL